MALSIRSRLTLWYSALLLLALCAFIAVVLAIHWRLLVSQYDESLETLSLMAVKVVQEEMGERSNLALASEDMASICGPPPCTTTGLIAVCSSRTMSFAKSRAVCSWPMTMTARRQKALNAVI